MALQLNTTLIPGLTIITDSINGGISIDYSAYLTRISNALEDISENLHTIKTIAVSNGSIDRIAVTDAGDGYTSASILISDPETGIDVATADISITDNKISEITLTNTGSNYRIPPTITISLPTGVINPAKFVAGANVSAGEYLFYLNNYYQVPPQGAGALGASGPTHTSGTAENGTAILKYVGRRASAVAILGAGSGIKTVNPYDLMAVASTYSYYIKNPDEIDKLLEATTLTNDLERLKELSIFVNTLAKLP